MKKLLKAITLSIIIIVMLFSQVHATDEQPEPEVNESVQNSTNEIKFTVNDISENWKEFTDEELSRIIGNSADKDVRNVSLYIK